MAFNEWRSPEAKQKLKRVIPANIEIVFNWDKLRVRM
jgi:hypothetical protein